MSDARRERKRQGERKSPNIETNLYGDEKLEERASTPEGGRGGLGRLGRCGAAPHTLTLFKTNIADFPTHFKTEFRFLLPCLRHLTQFKTTIHKSIPCLRQKMINWIPCSRQKSRKTYPGWPHVPIKPL